MAITTLKAGDKVTIGSGEDMFGTEERIIAQPCASKTNGYWYCINCQQQINPNFAPAKHERGNHKMFWMCMEHGPEQP